MTERVETQEHVETQDRERAYHRSLGPTGARPSPQVPAPQRVSTRLVVGAMG